MSDSAIHDNGTRAAGGVGIALSDTGHAVVVGDVVQRNSAAGIRADRASSSVRIASNRVAGNAKEGGVAGQPASTVSLTANVVTDNGSSAAEHSVNTVRFGRPAVWWPLAGVGGVVGLAVAAAVWVVRCRRRTAALR